MFKYNIILSVLLLLSSCTQGTTVIKYDNPALQYEGRIAYKSEAAEFSWSGTSVTIRFVGTEMSAILQDADTSNYYNVIVDNIVVSKIHPDTSKQTYLIASGLPKTSHTLQLFKRTEWDKGKTLFYGFEVGDGTILPCAEPRKRKMEFYGNSITCGYGNEDTSGKDRWIGYYQNNYETYGAITARHFDAQYHCIAKSGIGILVSWFPMIMSDMYNRTDPTDSTSTWDFSQYVPDVVVVNLFQNDSWIVNIPNNEQFKSRFGDVPPSDVVIVAAYKDFISSIRTVHPKASIICALGSMDATQDGSQWPGYIQEAVKQLNDSDIYTCFFPYKKSGGHPKVADHHVMADLLTAFIEEHVVW